MSTETKPVTAEEILNRLSKERKIYFYDAYIFNEYGIKTPTENMASNPLSVMILDAINEYAASLQERIKEMEAKAKRWDKLYDKISSEYGHENENGEWIENEDDGDGLIMIGVIAAQACGFL